MEKKYQRSTMERGITYSKEEEKDIKELYIDQNMTGKDVVKFLNDKYWKGKKIRTERGLESKFKRLGISKRDHSSYKEGKITPLHKKVWYLKKEVGWSYSKIAKKLNMSIGSIKSMISYMSNSTMLGKISMVDAKLTLGNDEQIADKRTKDELMSTINKLETQLTRAKASTSIIVDTVKSTLVKLPTVKIPDIIIKPGMHKPETAMLEFSDSHIGEKVLKEDVANVTEYSFNHFVKRLDALREGLFECIDIQRSKIPIKILDINMLGDICFEPNTLIMTKKGLIPIQDIKTGDEVLTHKNRYCSVTKIYKRKYNDNLVGITTTGNCNPVYMTPNHPVWTSDSYHGYYQVKGSLEFKRSDSLNKKSLVFNRINNEFISDFDVIDLTDWIKNTDIKIENYRIITTHNHSNDCSIPQGLNVNDQLCRIIGYFLGDGTITLNKKRGIISWSLKKNSRKEKKVLDDILQFCKHYDIKCDVYDNREYNTFNPTINSKPLAEFFSTFYDSNKEKTLPNLWLNLPFNKLKYIIYGFIMTDGNFRIDSTNKLYEIRISNTALKLLEKLKYRLEFEGYISNILKTKLRENQIINGKTVKNLKDSYSMSFYFYGCQDLYKLFYEFDKKPEQSSLHTKIVFDYVIKRVKSISYKKYTGYVYNLEIETDNTYIANSIIVHNCTGEDIYLGQMRNIDLELTKQVFEGAHTIANKLLLPCAKFFEKVRIRTVWGNHGRCLSKNMEILTQNGWKLYNEIKKGEIIPTMNIENNKVEYCPIEHITINEKEKEMYKGKSKTNNGLELTDDHTIVYYDRYNKIYKTKLLKEILSYKYEIGIPKTFTSGNKDLRNITNNELLLIGLILSDGSVEKVERGKPQIRVYQSKKKNIYKIKNLLNGLKVPYSIYTRQRNTEFICGKELKNKLRKEVRFYIKCSKFKDKLLKLLPDKNIQKWMFDLSDNQVNFLLHGLKLGDGNVRNGRIQKCGVKVLKGKTSACIWGEKKFLNDLQALLITHNQACSLVTDKRKDTYLYLNNKRHCIINKNIKKEEYNDISWCVTVKNHTIFVRNKYNGKSFIVGNTGKPGQFHPRTNFDYIVYLFLQNSLKYQKNIEFYIAECPVMLFKLPEAQNWTHLISHGNEVNSWMGIPFYGIQRDMGKYNQMFGENINFWHTGHFHSACKIDIPYGQQIVNGTFVGGSELSVLKMKTKSQPKQLLFGFNNARGKTWSYDIQLEPLTKLKMDENSIYTPTYQDKN